MCRLSIIRKLTEFSTSYFYNSVVKTSLRVLGLFKEWRTGLRAPIIGKFLSVFVYLARLSSVGVLSVIFRNGELIFFFFSGYLQLEATLCALRMEYRAF